VKKQKSVLCPQKFTALAPDVELFPPPRPSKVDDPGEVYAKAANRLCRFVQSSSQARTGLLFRNRYKSLVCDEDLYLLELVRYLNLNPLGVGIVPDLGGLGRFPWSVHSVSIGN